MVGSKCSLGDLPLSTLSALKGAAEFSVVVVVAAAAAFGPTAPRLARMLCMGRHTVSKLIGSPPGYVGYDEAGPRDTWTLASARALLKKDSSKTKTLDEGLFSILALDLEVCSVQAYVWLLCSACRPVDHQIEHAVPSLQPAMLRLMGLLRQLVFWSSSGAPKWDL